MEGLFSSQEAPPVFPATPLPSELLPNSSTFHRGFYDKDFDLIGPVVARHQENSRQKRKRVEALRQVTCTQALKASFKPPRTPSLDSGSATRHRRRTRRQSHRQVGTADYRRLSVLLGSSAHSIPQSVQEVEPPKDLFRGYGLLQFVKQDANFKHLCSFCIDCDRGTVATRRCFSCAKYDLLGKGNYCEKCFVLRHPWYRVAHNWASIAETEKPREEWAHHMMRLELERELLELAAVLKDVKHAKNHVIALDTSELGMAERVERAAAQYDSVDRTLRGIMDGVSRDLTVEEAAVRVQGLWRVRQARQRIRDQLRSIYVKLQDPVTGQAYFVNRLTEKRSTSTLSAQN